LADLDDAAQIAVVSCKFYETLDVRRVLVDDRSHVTGAGEGAR